MTLHVLEDSLDLLFHLLRRVGLDDPDSLVVGLLGMSPLREVFQHLEVLFLVAL